MYKLTTTTRSIAGLMGLAALAAGLVACGGDKTATTATASAPPAAVASATPAQSVDGEIVAVATLPKVQADVAASSLTSLDKNRFAAFIDDHPTIPGAYANKTVRDVINLQIAYEVALRLAAQARADDLLHQKILAKLITPHITIVSESAHTITLHMVVHNLSPKSIKNIEIGMEFDNAKTGARIGLVEVQLVRDIAGHGTIALDYPMRWVRFGEDTGVMMAAVGVPKKLNAQVTEIKYHDGTDAGFDD